MTTFFNPGVGVQETAAARYTRDIATRGGEYNTAYVNTKLDAVANLTLVATGRNDKEYGTRKGDLTYTGKILAPGTPKYDADGRNARLYCDSVTLVSALSADAFNPLATDTIV